MLEPDQVLAPVFDDAYTKIQEDLKNLQRELSAVLMSQFPDRQFLVQQAQELKDNLGAEGVEVNVLLAGRQITIVTQPSGITIDVSIPDENSLCVLTVGADTPMAVSSLSNSTFTATHPGRLTWESWASAPVHVNGFAAGTVCALEVTPRIWGDEEEQELMRVAQVISDAMDEWATKSKI